MKLERYITPEYLEKQKWLHSRPKGYGGGGAKWADAVVKMALLYQCNTILDYGCGQGKLAEAVNERMLENVTFTEYDPAIEGKDKILKYATFDLVTCTDVLEHIEPDRLAVVIDHLFKLTKKLLFLVIATRPSNKYFSDGRNVHLTIQPENWWRERLLHHNFDELEAPKSPLEKKSRELVMLLRRIE